MEIYRGPDRMRVMEKEEDKPKPTPEKPAAQIKEKNTAARTIADAIENLKPQYKIDFAKMKLAMEEKLKRTKEQEEVAAARKAEKIRMKEKIQQTMVRLAREREEERVRKVEEDNLERAKRRKIREEAAEKERKERLAKERELEARQRQEEMMKLDQEKVLDMVKSQRSEPSPTSSASSLGKQDKVKGDQGGIASQEGERRQESSGGTRKGAMGQVGKGESGERRGAEDTGPFNCESSQ